MYIKLTNLPIMNMKYRIIILIFAILIIWKTFQYYGYYTDDNTLKLQENTNLQHDIPEQIRVTVYYESLCSDSKNFILKQLLPTYDLLSKHITLDMVPYGKAKTIETDTGQIEFTCQHTAVECLGNKIHACTIEHVMDPKKRLDMISCMIDDNMIPLEAAERCANKYDINYNVLLTCSNGMQGSLLLKAYGERTENVQPAIRFIPTIELDGYQKVPLPKLLKDFKTELCYMFKEIPENCL